ncbi:MAG: hypothetical protein ACP5R2_15630, partial [Anaerolineae bacterium]
MPKPRTEGCTIPLAGYRHLERSRSAVIEQQRRCQFIRAFADARALRESINPRCHRLYPLAHGIRWHKLIEHPTQQQNIRVNVATPMTSELPSVA